MMARPRLHARRLRAASPQPTPAVRTTPTPLQPPPPGGSPPWQVRSGLPQGSLHLIQRNGRVVHYPHRPHGNGKVVCGRRRMHHPRSLAAGGGGSCKESPSDYPLHEDRRRATTTSQAVAEGKGGEPQRRDSDKQQELLRFEQGQQRGWVGDTHNAPPRIGTQHGDTRTSLRHTVGRVMLPDTEAPAEATGKRKLRYAATITLQVTTGRLCRLRRKRNSSTHRGLREEQVRSLH